MEKGGKPTSLSADRYAEGHFRRIGSNVYSYVGMVSDTLRNTIPKAVVYCQVREAKQSLLYHFYIQVGKKEVSNHNYFFILPHMHIHAFGHIQVSIHLEFRL